MKQLLIFHFGILISLLISCNNSTRIDTTESTETISLEKSTRFTSDTLVEAVEYIGLKPFGDNDIAGIDKIIRNDSLYIIGDLRHGTIYGYNALDGTPVFVIDQIGQGPGEYAELSCFCCDSDHIYVIDNMRRQMLTYDAKSGEFIESRKMPLIPDDVESLVDGGFIFATVPLGSQRKLSQSNHRLHISDQNLNITGNLFEYNEDESDPIGQRYYLSKSNRGIVFGSLMFDGYTVIDDKNPSDYRLIKVNFKHGLQGKRDIDTQEISNYEMLMTPPFVGGKNAIISFTNSNGRNEYGLWNSDLNEILPMPKESIRKAIMPIIGVDGDSFISYYNSYENYKAAVDHGFMKAPDDVEEILKSEGTALVIYRMRQDISN